MIPREIHRVWCGPNEPPAEHDYSEQWAQTNPAWELKTWGDDHGLDLVCQHEYDTAPTYVHRADIMLYETVWKFGGCAVGYDMEPLRDIEPLIEGHDCWCTPDADGFPGQAFFGAQPEHPAIGAVLEALPKRIAERGWGDPHKDTGPYLFGSIFGRFGEHAAAKGLDILGTWMTAYPVRYWEKDIFNDPKRYAQRTRDAFVVHRFAGSWLRNGGEDVKVRRD